MTAPPGREEIRMTAPAIEDAAKMLADPMASTTFVGGLKHLPIRYAMR
jgi:hypothetical protein